MKLPNVDKFWKILALWFLITVVFALFNSYFINKFQQYRNEGAQTLYLEYRKTLSSPKALISAIDDILSYDKAKQKILEGKKVDNFTLSLCDTSNKNMVATRKIQQFFAMPLIILFIIGGCSWLFYFFKVIFYLARKQFKIIYAFKLFMFSISIVAIYFISTNFNNDNTYLKSVNVSYSIVDYEFTAYGGLIELSNAFYDLDTKETTVLWLAQVEYIKIKTQERIEKIKKLQPKKDKDITYFDSDNITKPTLVILNEILKFTEIATTKTKNEQEEIAAKAKAIAQFKSVLDRMYEYALAAKALTPFDNSMLDLFTDEAKKTYESMEKDKEYSIYLLFGNNLYEFLKNNLQANE